MKNLYLTVLLSILLHVVFSQNTWSSIASFGGGERERAIAFVIGERAYVGTGIDTANICRTDIWEYDPGTNSWTQKADVPGTARRDAIAFSIGNRGYVGTGINGVIAWTGSKKDDFYEYNPVTNIWTAKKDWEGNFGSGIYYASAFATDTKGYLVCGKLGSSYYSSELWEFDPVANDWIKKANFPPGTRYGASAFSISGKGYVGCGADEDYYRNDFYEYDPQTNIWTQKADFPGSPRFNAVGLSIMGRGFIGMGTDGGNQKDFYEYDPLSDSWTQKANLPASERRSCVAFTIGNYGYAGIGKGPDGVKRSMFKYKPYFLMARENEVAALSSIVSPNPVELNATISINGGENISSAQLYVYNSNGAPVYSANKINNSAFNFERNNLPAGLYLYEIKTINIKGETNFTSGKIFLI